MGSKGFADRRSIPLMIGLDTNVLVRFLVRDGEEQFERASKLIRRRAQDGQPVRISLLVLLETEWVLRTVLYHQAGR
jgi:predicted nucleic-acid-binding protein